MLVLRLTSSPALGHKVRDDVVFNVHLDGDLSEQLCVVFVILGPCLCEAEVFK